MRLSRLSKHFHVNMVDTIALRPCYLRKKINPPTSQLGPFRCDSEVPEHPGLRRRRAARVKRLAFLVLNV
jgi:hypothetical protein